MDGFGYKITIGYKTSLFQDNLGKIMVSNKMLMESNCPAKKYLQDLNMKNNTNKF